MTPTKAEFNGEFNGIRLNIQIEGKIAEKKKQKAHLEENICANYKKISQFHKRKFTQSELKWHRIMQNLMINSTIFNWKFKSKRKSQKKTNKQHIWKRKFVVITKNFTISQEKVYSTRIQMTPTNAELNAQFNEIQLTIQIEAKISEEKKQKRYSEVKICLNYTKFHNFTRVSSMNSNSNDTEKCRIE